jgi:high-affinity iron transporter
MRRIFSIVLAPLAIVLAVVAFAGSPARASGSGTSVSRSDALEKVQQTRESIDRTLELIKQGKSEQAFQEAKSGYLAHFELVEIPLRVADNALTIKAESLFAEIRTMIRDGRPVSDTRDKIIELRGVMDDVERKLTAMGAAAPMLIAGQSFLIIFREGFEVVLLLSILLGYLEAAKSTRYMRPIVFGVLLAAVATVATVFLLRTVFAALPVSHEMLEAITALVAVAVLFYVSFWLIARLEHKRWLEFVRARMWSAVSLGSTMSLVLVGFTAVYREGFETALFYQALLSFGTGLGWFILGGVAAGVVALAVVAWLMFRVGRKLPIKLFMNVAVALVMATSVAFLGNAVHALQSADKIPYTPLAGWPRMPIFLAEATGYWPTVQTVAAQFTLAAVYLLGAVYVFVVKPQLARRAARPRRPQSPAKGTATAGTTPV